MYSDHDNARLFHKPTSTLAAACPACLQPSSCPCCAFACRLNCQSVAASTVTLNLASSTCSLIRQQPQVVDAGASLVYAHYTLTARQPTAGGVQPSSSGGSGGSSSGSDGSTSSSDGSSDGSPIFTDSLWFSPPGNVRPGQFNMTSIDIGLQHLLLRTTASAAQAAEGAAALTAGQPATMQAGARVTAKEAAAAEAAAAAGPLSRRLTLDFVVGPLAVWQQKHVRSYLLSSLWPGPAWRRRTLLLLSLCVWEQEEAAPK